MRIGFGLPNIGPLGSPENLLQVAERAEALGYDSLWTIERLLWPVKPQTPYPVTADGSLPEGYKYCLDPLDTLTFVAAHTEDRARPQRSRYSVLQPGHAGAPAYNDRRAVEWKTARGSRPRVVEGRNGRHRCRHEAARSHGGRVSPGAQGDLDHESRQISGQVL